MEMVISTENELQLEVDRLRNERDLAREEATQAREEREAAMLQVNFAKSMTMSLFELNSSPQYHRHEKMAQNASLWRRNSMSFVRRHVPNYFLAIFWLT